MFSKNGIISDRQLFRLYVFNLLGVGTLILPSVLAGQGKYGFISIITGALMTWFFMLLSTMAMKKECKKKYIYFFIVIYQIMLGSFLAWMFVRLIRTSLIPKESFAVILLVIMAVSAYALSGGVECRARAYEVVFWFVIIPLIAMLLFAACNMKKNYWEIEDSFSIKGVLYGAYCVFAAGSSVSNIFFLKGRSCKNVRKSVGKAIVVYTAILLLLYAVLLGNFGKPSLSEIEFPAVILMSDVQIKGNFFKRADALMLAIWFFTVFSILNMTLFYATESAEKLCKKVRNKFIASLIVVLATIVGALIMEYGDNFVKRYLEFLLCLGLPIVVIIILGINFSACSSVELEDRCFPTLAAVNIDKNNKNKIMFYYNMEKTYKPVTANDIRDAVEQFDSMLSQQIDTNHMKVILIGEELYENKARYNELMEFCKESGEFPRNTYVCVVDDISSTFDNMGEYYEQKLEKQKREKGIPIETLGTLMDNYTNSIK